MSNRPLQVVSASYLGNHQLKIQFNDGHEVSVDFKPFIFNHSHPEITKYRDEALFEDFSITDGDLEWHDYELCFPVADLYENKNINLEKDYAA